MMYCFFFVLVFHVSTLHLQILNLDIDWKLTLESLYGLSDHSARVDIIISLEMVC